MSDAVTVADEASGGEVGEWQNGQSRPESAGQTPNTQGEQADAEQADAEQPDEVVIHATKPTDGASTAHGSLGGILTSSTVGGNDWERTQSQSGARSAKGKARGSPKPESIKLRSPRSSANYLSRGSTLPPKAASVAGQKTTWPDCVPEDVRERVEKYKAPEGFTLKERPKKATSLVWFAGAWVTHDKTKEDGWICLADDRCAEEGAVKAYSGASSNWVRHLETHHNLKSTRGVQMEARKEEACDRLSKAKNANWFKMGLHRYRNMIQARLMVKKFLPFSYVTDKEVRHHHAAMMQAEEEPTLPLSEDGVKHIMLEMYSATKEQETGKLRALADSACLPFLHLNVDKCDDEGSGRSFLVVRAFWVQDWQLRSANLAIKLYVPFSAVVDTEKKASDILFKWLKGVLAEHRLTVGDIYSSTSDAGSDIKHLLKTLLSAKWAWCVPHMANHAMNEGMGSDLDTAKSKNQGARAEIQKVKSVVEHLNKSPKMNAMFKELQVEELHTAFNFVNGAPHRWLSKVRVVERLLALWVPLREHCKRNEENKTFPLNDSEIVLSQLFALIYPISDTMQESEVLHTPCVGKTLVNMARLKRSVLNCDAPLTVVPFPTIINNEEFVPAPVEVDHADLHAVARAAREKLASAFFTCFYGPYWAEDAYIIMDMALVLHPPLKKLKHIGNMRLTEKEGKRAGQGGATSEAQLKARRQKVYAAIKKEALAAATKARENVGVNTVNTESRGSPADLRPEQSAPKRQKTMTVREARLRQQAAEYQDMVDSSEDDEMPSVPLTPQAQVEAEWTEYYEMTKIGLTEVPFEEVLLWWANHGCKKFRWLSHVARSVLGHPATAVAIERDFSMVGQMLSPRRSRLDAVYAEILMYLNVNLDHIPTYIPEIRTKEAHHHLPTRLKGIDELDKSVTPSAEEIEGDAAEGGEANARVS